MKIIEKLKILNFKRFKNFEINFDPVINLFIGDNESGKSTLLSAIDLVLSGSRNKVETLGLDRIFNSESVTYFLASNKKIENLPILQIELYFNDQGNPDLNGNFNSDNRICDGLLLLCEPRLDLTPEIKEVLQEAEENFPFEYYSISFRTFSGESYTGYRKFFRHIFLDNTQINNEYATRKYISTLYGSNVNDSEKSKHQNEYRKRKEIFRNEVLNELNGRIPDYGFAIKTTSKANLETDLTIVEDEIDIENKGKGRQCFIKTEFALWKSKNPLDIVLLEEPENHLSHTNMRSLIYSIDSTESKQLFIATHSTLISSRLDLRKAILLNSSSSVPVFLYDLSETTARFFMKAPDNNILEFILSERALLVEGDAEYILMEAFFENHVGRKLDNSGIHIISVDGTSFKRYLELARLLDIKTAVITDNDEDYQTNCVDRYKEYIGERMAVFADEDESRWTFEIAVYDDNREMCEDLFGPNRKKLTVPEYMLKNKSEAAFTILEKGAKNVVVPAYIQDAIAWINE